MAHEVAEGVLADSVASAAADAVAATVVSAAAAENPDAPDAVPTDHEDPEHAMVDPDHTTVEVQVQETKVNDETVNEVALADDAVKQQMDVSAPADAHPQPAESIMTSVPVSVSVPPAPATAPMQMPVNVTITALQEPAMKDEETLNRTEEQLVEVAEAMMAANDVFNRVKSEKIAEQALCSIRNDQAQYEGLAKEIVGKAIKQKERERANRASAAASRAKVMRYQTELESRLNRMEAERNAYRREVHDLKNSADGVRKLQPDEVKQLTKLQDWIRKMEAANPQFVRSIIAQGEMDKILGEAEQNEMKLEVEDIKDDEQAAKRRRL